MQIAKSKWTWASTIICAKCEVISFVKQIITIIVNKYEIGTITSNAIIFCNMMLTFILSTKYDEHRAMNHYQWKRFHELYKSPLSTQSYDINLKTNDFCFTSDVSCWLKRNNHNFSLFISKHKPKYYTYIHHTRIGCRQFYF